MLLGLGCDIHLRLGGRRPAVCLPRYKANVKVLTVLVPGNAAGDVNNGA